MATFLSTTLPLILTLICSVVNVPAPQLSISYQQSVIIDRDMDNQKVPENIKQEVRKRVKVSSVDMFGEDFFEDSKRVNIVKKIISDIYSDETEWDSVTDNDVNVSSPTSFPSASIIKLFNKWESQILALVIFILIFGAVSFYWIMIKRKIEEMEQLHPSSGVNIETGIVNM